MELCDEAVRQVHNPMVVTYVIDAIRELAKDDYDSVTRMDGDYWIDRRLGQLGIDVRQRRAHKSMLEYLRLLKQEISMTQQFLDEYGWIRCPPPPKSDPP